MQDMFGISRHTPLPSICVCVYMLRHKENTNEMSYFIPRTQDSDESGSAYHGNTTPCKRQFSRLPSITWNAWNLCI